MHYSSTAFNKNKRPTIVSKEWNVVIGQRRGLSAIDIIEIRRLYGYQGGDHLIRFSYFVLNIAIFFFLNIQILNQY